MKTKKEILQEYLDDAQETLTKIEITTKYVQGKFAQNNKQHLLEELGKLQANQKETEEWIKFLNEEIGQESK
jgi:hypothetical protein